MMIAWIAALVAVVGRLGLSVWLASRGSPGFRGSTVMRLHVFLRGVRFIQIQIQLQIQYLSHSSDTMA